MGEFGNLLGTSITSQRSYGATNSQNFMLAVIDSKVLKHELQPSDTLQGLAIKYGVSVEHIKRLNKLWSNDSIHSKETLLIPYSNLSSKTSLEDHEEKSNTKKTKEPLGSYHSNHTNVVETENAEKTEESEALKTFNEMIGKIDNQLKTHKKDEQDDLNSPSYKCFTEMLSKIDSQINIQKLKHKTATPTSNLPPVGYDSYQNMEGHTSPIKQHSFLEQGI